ncbi:hypothetical protein GCM10010271_41840 [Streptomyces kurssanovii]|nr:hypothetical protein GCM10010271_41840 [Streptomyces kurssanovii]
MDSVSKRLLGFAAHSCELSALCTASTALSFHPNLRIGTGRSRPALWSTFTTVTCSRRQGAREDA